MNSITVEEIKLEEFTEFFRYLSKHLSENGMGNDILFLPLSKDQLQKDHEWEEKFMTGFHKEFGRTGWRKLWIAKNHENQIIGHIDIRSRNELNTRHRVLLGMGVDSGFRKMRIGQQLLDSVIEYCENHTEIDWIDLEVLTNNTPAISLYSKNNFKVLANFIDMFRIDGKSYDYTSMTLMVS